LEESCAEYVVFYESADDVMSKALPVYPRHLARLKEFRDRGDLLLVGTFGDPQAEGSMAVFGSREAAEEFVRDDPFVNEGVVKRGRCGSGTRSRARFERVPIFDG
jgi:uncharacterized protein YciI